MADPFSIITGTVGLIDVCWRFGTYLKDVQAAAAKVEEEIAALQREIQALITVNESLKDICAAEFKASKFISATELGHVENLWQSTAKNLRDCRATVEKLQKATEEAIAGSEYNQLRQILMLNQGGLQLMLSALNLVYVRRSRESTDESLDLLSEKVLSLEIRSQIDSLRPRIGSIDGSTLRDSIISASLLTSALFSNEYFDIPQPVNSIFTGRGALLDELKVLLDDPNSSEKPHIQKCFVLFGLGGAGKTQLVCKFAEENRQHFWDIFWIDASSDESAKQSFCRIAEIGKVDRNERAAKAWLSQLERSWLLLLDSADNPQISVEKYFPGGERGCIIITTRNHAHKVHGTVGSRFCHLERLDSDDANELLLKAAQYEPRPWDSAVKKSAAIICEALGYLPLALIHAGWAILNHLCSLGDYLGFYTENWRRIRHAWKFLGLRGEDEDSYIKVYSTAATNPRLELEHQEKEKHDAEHAKYASSYEPLHHRLKIVRFGLLSILFRDRGPPVLPAVLRDVQASGSFDQLRLKLALKDLDQISLITYHESNKSYSMHLLVHTWVRERPEMSTAEQAVWSQAAATALSQCILLPPLGTTEYDEHLIRNLLPHVDFVRKCHEGIEARIHENRKSRKSLWPAISSKFDQREALQSAKFSMVYSQCGLWEETEKLQLSVKNFACEMLGMAHPRATLIVLALSSTYLHQGRVNDAAELQRQLLRACVSALGMNHPRALKVRDELGKTLCYQSRFKEALVLHKEAVEGTSKVLGDDHKDTLLAIDNLGVVYLRYLEFDKARELHARCVARMGRVFGPLHLDTLISKERLAMTSLDITGEATSTIDNLRSALYIMDQVLEERKTKLGKEHPYTLLAFCNLARIKNALGNSEEAEKIIRAKLPIAERSLGDKHLGVIAAKVHLGQVLVRQKRYVEAETMFHDLMQLEKYQIAAREEGEHVDRIVTMISLLRCYEIQGKVKDALRLCDMISTRIKVIDGLAHPLAQRVEDKRLELEAMIT